MAVSAAILRRASFSSTAVLPSPKLSARGCGPGLVAQQPRTSEGKVREERAMGFPSQMGGIEEAR